MSDFLIGLVFGVLVTVLALSDQINRDDCSSISNENIEVYQSLHRCGWNQGYLACIKGKPHLEGYSSDSLKVIEIINEIIEE